MELRIALKIIEAKDYNSAGKILLELYQQDPSNELIQYHLARVYEKKEMFAKAEKLLKDILKNEPGYNSANFLLGKIYEKWGEKQEHLQTAVNYFSKIPDSAQNHSSAKKYIGSIKKQIGIVNQINDCESMSTEYFDEHELTNLGLLIRDIDELKVCSRKDEYYFRIAQVYSNIKSARFNKAREDGVKFSELSRIKEFDTLDKVLNTYLQKAGFKV